ncbi:hypothetical protein [Luteimonas saliphila]|uniref:hypothetical protein n=1 Tax=Luteimonas saliphila TaxID=2804919 RepID=UPI00192E2423|nr:hypothetical protein [Luteimonas saliphila]
MIATCRLNLFLAIALLPAFGHACDQAPALEGVLSIPQCDPASADADCVPGSQAAYEALEALEVPDVFTIGVQTSPWRMYDAEGRILTIDEVAAAIRAGRPESDRRVHLAGSWTAARPDGDGETLAHRVSVALDGFPVDGSDGFLWLSPTGAMRTTKQAFSVWKSGPYRVARGEDVLMALVPGAIAQFEDQFANDGLAAGVVEAGIGFDVFMLCQERALAAFERAAGMGSAIGAYNAGLMHVDLGDRTSAITWLELAKRLGESKATAVLADLQQ